MLIEECLVLNSSQHFLLSVFVPLLVEAILIYLHHNANALALMRVNVRELLPIDALFFQTFVEIQAGFAFFIALLVGPPIVSRDLRNNALPLYLCRPFSERVCARQNVGASHPALIDYVGAAVVAVFLPVLP